MIARPSNQTVGRSLTLECNGTTVRGITSNVDIEWKRHNTIVNTTRVTATTTMNNSLLYIDSYTISQLNTTEHNVSYRCTLIVRSTPERSFDDNMRLDVTGKILIETFIYVHDLYRISGYFQRVFNFGCFEDALLFKIKFQSQDYL